MTTPYVFVFLYYGDPTVITAHIEQIKRAGNQFATVEGFTT